MPGAGKQPPEMQAQIRTLLEAGFDPTTIHRRLKVGRSSIYRMKRCLERHGTAYMPPELNKKNGRPKVLTAEQELEVRDWLRRPENRNCYLDDLVWLLHDRFTIVCSTTTMSKLKRKWLRVIEMEETGRPLDEATRVAVGETHPELLEGGVEMGGVQEGGMQGDGMGPHVLDPAMRGEAAVEGGTMGLMERFAVQPGLGEVEERVERELGIAGPSVV